jgi:hypothetical protein
VSPWGAPPAMEEIVAAVGLGLRKRSWPPSGWGYGRGGSYCNLPLTSPCSRSKPSPPLEHTCGWGSSSNSSVSSWARAVGYGRDRGCCRVGATKEVVATVGLGLWKRSRLPQPASHAKPSPPPEHTHVMGELVLLLAHDPADAPTKLLPLHVVGDPAGAKEAWSAP